MRYAVLGTGPVGETLATKLVELGHEVRMGARLAGNAAADTWAMDHGRLASAGDFTGAAAWAERVIVAVKGAAVLDLARSLPRTAVDGKLVIDVTNPLDLAPGKPPSLLSALSNTTSAGEALQAAWPGARVVKTLNTMHHTIMVDPSRVPGPHDVFLCGDYADAKAEAGEMLNAFGWSDPVDLGGLAAARGTEGLMLFWLQMWQHVGSAEFNYRIERA